MFFLPLIPHTPTDTKSKINHKINKKNQPLEQNRWIGVDGNQWWVDVDRFWWRSVMGWCGSVLMEIGDGLTEISVDGDRCWWSACNGLSEKRKEKDSQKKKKKGEEREAEIEIKMVWRRGYSEEKEGCWWSACDGLTEKRKEKYSHKKKKKEKKKEDWEEREAEIEIRIVWRRRRRGYSE